MTEKTATVVRIIARTVEEARAAGLDRSGQDWRAVKAIMLVDPGLSESRALRLVEMLRAD